VRHKWTTAEKVTALGLWLLCAGAIAGCFIVPSTAVPCAVMAASIATGFIGWLTPRPGRTPHDEHAEHHDDCEHKP